MEKCAISSEINREKKSQLGKNIWKVVSLNLIHRKIPLKQRKFLKSWNKNYNFQFPAISSLNLLPHLPFFNFKLIWEQNLRNFTHFIIFFVTLLEISQFDTDFFHNRNYFFLQIENFNQWLDQKNFKDCKIISISILCDFFQQFFRNYSILAWVHVQK